MTIRIEPGLSPRTRRRKAKAEPAAPAEHRHISKDFVLAGEAVFTIEVPEAFRRGGVPHYTYKVEKAPSNSRWPGNRWFVKLLTGPDNNSNYTYLGMLDDFTSEVRATRATSPALADGFALKLLNRVLARVWGDDHDAYEKHGFRTHHEGHCGRCGRRLTTPESVERGIGPECTKLMGGN